MRSLIANDENDGEIDRILSREDEILPSSGFSASVMDAVRREAAAAAAPPPIPFPWLRALPGLVVAGLTLILVLVAGVVEIAQLARASTSTDAQFSLTLPSALSSALNRGVESAALWAVLALLATWASVKLSMLLASDRM
ncbi:MAG: hypothetical protein ACLPLR_02090 [Terriglobales bacterium]